MKPHRRHHVAHRAAHRWEPCEIGGIVEMLRSENVRDDEVVGEAGEGLARVGKARGSSDGHEVTARVSRGGMRFVRRHRTGCRVRVVCAWLCIEDSEKSVTRQSACRVKAMFRNVPERRRSHNDTRPQPHDNNTPYPDRDVLQRA